MRHLWQYQPHSLEACRSYQVGQCMLQTTFGNSCDHDHFELKKVSQTQSLPEQDRKHLDAGWKEQMDQPQQNQSECSYFQFASCFLLLIILQ